MNIARKFEFFQSKKSRCLSYDFKGGDLSSEGGLILLREFDDKVGFSQGISDCIVDRINYAISKSISDPKRDKLESLLSHFEGAASAKSTQSSGGSGSISVADNESKQAVGRSVDTHARSTVEVQDIDVILPVSDEVLGKLFRRGVFSRQTITSLKERLNATEPQRFRQTEKRKLQDASLHLRVTEYKGNESELYGLHEAMERHGIPVIPLLNSDVLTEFEDQLRDKANNQFKYATIMSQTLDRWHREGVENIGDYSRPDFLQESHFNEETQERFTIDMHRAIFLRKVSGITDLTGRDLLDAKVAQFVTDAYSLGPIRARDADTEHLQSFDQFKKQLGMFFGHLNGSTKKVKEAVYKQYKGTGLMSRVRRGRVIVYIPTESTMRLGYSLFKNTLLMSHYFNIVKGKKETEEVLQESKEHGTPLARSISAAGDIRDISKLMDKWQVIGTLRSDDLVREDLRGKPLYEAIHGWIEEGADIQNMMRDIEKQRDRKSYLYIVANRLQKDRNLLDGIRSALRERCMAALEIELSGGDASEARHLLKEVVRDAYRQLPKDPSPGAARAMETSNVKGRPRENSGDSAGSQGSGTSGTDSVDSGSGMRGPLGYRQKNVKLRERLRETEKKSVRLESELEMANQTIAGLKAQMATKDSRIDNLEAQMTDQVAENKALRVQMEAQSKRMDQLMAMLEAQVNVQNQNREEGATSKE